MAEEPSDPTPNTCDLSIDSPAFGRLEKSNDAPSEDSCHPLRRGLNEAERHLTNLSTELVAARQQLAIVSAEHAKAANVVNRYAGILSPVRRLPSDVLTMIFMEYIGSNASKLEREWVLDTGIAPQTPAASRMLENAKDLNSLDTQRGPWVLGQVSRQWRFVATTNPRLWHFVGINSRLFGSPAKSIIPLVSLLALRLQRSGSQPLDIYLSGDDEISCNHPLVAILCSHSSRWRALRLSIPLKSLCLGLAPIKGNLGCLEQVILVPGPINNGPGSTYETDIFEHVPNLKKVVVFGSPNTLVSCPIPWTNVQVLACPSACFCSVSKQIIAAQDLRAFSLVCNQHANGLLAPGLHFTKVHTVCLGGLETHHILDALVLPNLRALKLEMQNLSISADVLLRFFQRSSCSLATFDLTVKDVEGGPRLVQALRAIPSVTSFTLVAPGAILDSVLLALTPPIGSTSALLPKLGYFGIHIWNSLGGSRVRHLNGILNMIERRHALIDSGSEAIDISSIWALCLHDCLYPVNQQGYIVAGGGFKEKDDIDTVVQIVERLKTFRVQNDEINICHSATTINSYTFLSECLDIYSSV
ncbi:hypothetical protein VKT23_012177 [Stygiomarasmius scandens]|uniref:F-box domain-containing protein n=1 Tax=Marasmiellus scandens TaxID=2682957 RepID=A0ABR1J744_9AGAR